MWWMYYADSFRLSLLTAASVFSGALINLRNLRPQSIGKSSVEKGFILFLAIAWLSLLTGSGISAGSWAAIEKMTKTLAFMFVMMRIVYKPKEYLALRWVWIVGALWLGYNAYSKGSSWYVDGRLSGVGGSDFQGSSGFGAHMAISLPFIGIAFLSAQKWWLKIIPFLAAGLTVNSLIASQTRGAFLAIAIGGIVAVFRVPAELRKKLFFYFIVGAVGALSLANESFWERMDTIEVEEEEQRESSSQSRLEIWAASLEMLADYPLGVGIGRFQKHIGHYAPNHTGMASHNTFVRCYGDLGIHGLAVFLFIIYAMYNSLYRMRKQLMGHPSLYYLNREAYALEIALTVAFVAGFFTERTYVEGYWLLMSMVPCLEQTVAYCLQESESRQGGNGPSTYFDADTDK